MTKINKVVMHGFKSFAKHTELLFGDQFNVVLGPNGSGKSNVLDALCFVLGKTSAKSMRAEKSANLIYNGGKEKKPARQAEVSIYFDNAKRVFPTDDKEVKVTRIVRPDGQSLYKINDKKRNRQEVVDLLNIAKINPDAYNVILQGDIIRFCEMPPIERRQLIEEIAGISVYEEKKHKALLELGKVDERLKEAEIVLTERNTYLKELKKDRDQAMKFRDMENKIRQFKASLLKIQIEKKEAEKKENENSNNETLSQLNNIQQKISKLRQDSEEKKKQIEDITKEIEEKGEVEQVRLNREVESLKINLTKSSSRMETLKTELVKISKRKQDLRNSIKDAKDRIAGLKNEISALERNKLEDTQKKEGLSKKVAQIRERNKLENITNIEKKVEALDKEAEELQQKINNVRERQHNLLREKDLVEHQINIADETIKKVDEIQKEYRQQLDLLEEKRKEFKKTTLELNKKLDEDSVLGSHILNAQRKLLVAQEDLAKLRAKNITIRENAIGDIAVKKILELKKAGVYGTVSELGDVNVKYSIALEVAAGPRIKSIVVEDDRIAADCIKYLKQGRLGSATFLPMNKLRTHDTSSEIKKLANAKGSHGIAMDLIDYDPKFKKVFQYILADTVVVDDIDVARRLGIGNAKMVTLDGDITELSGVMQGGYRLRKQQFGFKEKEITKEIEKTSSATDELKNTINTLEKRRKENDELIAQMREKKASLEGEIIKTEKSLHLDSKDLDITKQKKDELLASLKLVNSKLNGIAQEISDINKKLAANKIDRQKLREEISQLRDPALLAELTAYEEKINEISNEIVRQETDMRNMKAQIASIYEPEIEKTNGILKQLDKDEEIFNNEVKDIKSNMTGIEKTLKEKEEQSKQFYSRFKSLFSNRSKINEFIQKNDSIINNRIDESRKIEIKNNTFSLKLAEIKAVLAGMLQEFQQYEGITIDDSKNEDQLKYEISKFEKMKIEIGNVNMRALEIYEEVEKEYNNMMAKKDSLSKEKDDVMKMMEEIESKKTELFMSTFSTINENFKNIFSTISTKGDAYLELENPKAIFEEGIRIKVRISGQKFLDIRSLSGGEKTLTALAFIFAIQEHDPASFYVLDEVDAALDKHNSEKFAKLIRKYTEKAQYLIITHNDNVISEADYLYGISMNEHGMSQVVSLKI